MTKLAAPLIIAAHVETLPTLTGWAGVTVFDGAAVTREDVREYVTVGYVPDADTTLTLEHVPTAQGTAREAGSVASQLIVAAADVPTARERVFDLLDAWSSWLVADRTLRGTSGQARLMPGSEAHLSVDVALATTRAGATANAVVTVTYTALTYG